LVSSRGFEDLLVPRQSYTAMEKLRVLAEYDHLPHGEKGEFLRREGLRSSTISQWRAQREAGALSELSRGPGRPPSSDTDRENAMLRDEVAALRRRVAEMEEVIETQGNLSALLEGLAVGGVTTSERESCS
jgi:transposase